MATRIKKKRSAKKSSRIKAVRKHSFTRQGDFRVYVLECCDGTFYTGHTKDLPARIKLHRSGKGSRYVRSRLPFKLVYTKKYRYFKAAFAEEFRVKGLTRLQKKSLIRKYRLDRRIKRSSNGKE
ncbi:MAG: GIY-YIG nuclease family protein [Candidatus Omnitrophica bacterium]|nr:GIY-YIG nuclease family protein [Candidatus Omnitrophota bacterium]